MTDFPPAEFAARLHKAQAAMSDSGLDAVLLCTEAEIRYFSGFRTLFWQSPTRPWFLILPREGDPVAVIPGIGAQLMATTRVKDIRTWSSPNPSDDGVSLLAEALSIYDIAYGRGSQPGMVMTLEPSMPTSDDKMMVLQENILITDDAPILLTQRAAPELPVIR